MRKISAAKSEASSPPVPARISRITFFSSLGSLGSSSTLSSSSRAAARGSSAAISSCAISAQLGVAFGEHGARIGQALAHLLQLAVLLHRSLHLAQRFRDLLVFFVVVEDLRQRELRLHLVVALLHLFQSIDDHMPALRGFYVLDE